MWFRQLSGICSASVRCSQELHLPIVCTLSHLIVFNARCCEHYGMLYLFPDWLLQLAVNWNQWIQFWTDSTCSRLRVYSDTGCHSSISDLLHSLHWMHVHCRLKFKILVATVCFEAAQPGSPSFVTAMWTSLSSAFLQYGFVKCSLQWHFSWTSSHLAGWIMHLEWVTPRAASVQHNSVFWSLLMTHFLSEYGWVAPAVELWLQFYL